VNRDAVDRQPRRHHEPHAAVGVELDARIAHDARLPQPAHVVGERRFVELGARLRDEILCERVREVGVDAGHAHGRHPSERNAFDGWPAAADFR
jgi:hypothetical protein